MPESVRKLVDAIISLMKNREFDIFETPVERRINKFAKSHDYAAIGKAMAEDRKNIYGNQESD